MIDQPNDDNLIASDELANGKQLTKEETSRIQGPPGVSDFQRQKLERDAKKNWDLFYKRNGDRFFKRRYWTRREFAELLSHNHEEPTKTTRYLLEIGCGCGDFVLPLLEVNPNETSYELPTNLFVYCCDISDVAIDILTSSQTYKNHHPDKIKAFVANVIADDHRLISAQLDDRQMDFVSLVFILSALDPDQMPRAIENISCLLKPNGLVLFRDYAIYDKAMIRFKPESKIADQFYVRQDGTRAYFFAKQQLVDLFARFGFTCESICYIERETINNATKDKYSRVFLQAKFRAS